ncbi:NAD-binding protein [Cupriavidus basilensis]
MSGNAAEPAVLIQAHIARAAMLVVAIADPLDVRQMADIARTLNPSIEIVLRTHNEDESRHAAQGGNRHGLLRRGRTGPGHDRPCAGTFRSRPARPCRRPPGGPRR